MSSNANCYHDLETGECDMHALAQELVLILRGYPNLDMVRAMRALAKARELGLDVDGGR